MSDFEYRVLDPIGLGDAEPVQKDQFILPHFKANELACRHCGLIHLATGFGEHLVVLRMTYNLPMQFTSVCRCSEHNKNEGGHVSSAHICDEATKHVLAAGCCAGDVWHADEKLITLAMKQGWSVGISYDGGKVEFAHLDRVSDYSSLKDYQRLFFYDSTPDDARNFWTDRFHEIQRLNGMFDLL